MEHLTNEQIYTHLAEVLEKISLAKDMVDDGKEVLCSRKLQGALVSLTNLMVRLVGNSEEGKT